MNAELTQVFAYDETMLRVLGTPEAPLFMAKDACQALGLENHREAVSRLPENEKGVISNDSLGGAQNMLYVTESGLYRLIFSCRKPEAKRFQDWVFKEVLPSIRKTGSYGSVSQWLIHAYETAKTGAVQRDILRLMNIPLPLPAPRPSAVGNEIVTKFFEEMIAAFQAKVIPMECFRVESAMKLHPPGASEQVGEWPSCVLYMNPNEVLAAMQKDYARRGQVGISYKELRDQISQFDFWLKPPEGRKLNKRFGKPGRLVTAAAWGITVDLHPLGYRPCADDEYQNFLAQPGAVDPRKGPLFTIIEGLK